MIFFVYIMTFFLKEIKHVLYFSNKQTERQNAKTKTTETTTKDVFFCYKEYKCICQLSTVGFDLCLLADDKKISCKKQSSVRYRMHMVSSLIVFCDIFMWPHPGGVMVGILFQSPPLPVCVQVFPQTCLYKVHY